MAETLPQSPVPADAAATARPAVFDRLAATPGVAGQPSDIGMVMDIPVQLTVQLGRTRLPIRDVLQLAQGSVVELDGLAGEPLDVYVNGCLLAQGEVVVVNEKFGIRLTDIVTPAERARKLPR
ncbi:MAG TPA: flagellar motor switch protein FliN [Casimicrobiaceae bacterium]